MTPMPIALLLALAIWPFAHAKNPAPIRHQRLDGWTLQSRRDRFTGKVTCEIQRDRVTVSRQAVVFHFPIRINTYDASYRIDGGPLRKARDDADELAIMGFALHYDDLANPSAGFVRIPWRRIAQAQYVQIEPEPFSRPWRFRLDGLDAALDAAKNRGCDSIGPTAR
jgi:hypothetical protein